MLFPHASNVKPRIALLILKTTPAVWDHNTHTLYSVSLALMSSSIMTTPNVSCHHAGCQSSSSSRMRVINHNWSATKQHLHQQSVAEISRHSFCQGTGFHNVGHRLGLTTRTQIGVCKSPFPSAGTAVSLFCAKTEASESKVTNSPTITQCSWCNNTL